MSRRSKLIYLWSFNAIAASTVVALVTLLLASGGSSAEPAAFCGVNNAPTTTDSYLPVNDSFETIIEAETFICHEVAYPRSTPGWAMEHISASRSGPAADVGRGLGFASVTFDYLRPDNRAADLRVEVSPYHIDPVAYGIIDQVKIMGSKANLIQGNDKSLFILQWEADGYSFYAEARVTDDFGLPDLYNVLNSIE
jgi:hypothetical protein